MAEVKSDRFAEKTGRPHPHGKIRFVRNWKSLAGGNVGQKWSHLAEVNPLGLNKNPEA